RGGGRRRVRAGGASSASGRVWWWARRRRELGARRWSSSGPPRVDQFVGEVGDGVLPAAGGGADGAWRGLLVEVVSDGAEDHFVEGPFLGVLDVQLVVVRLIRVEVDGV